MHFDISLAHLTLVHASPVDLVSIAGKCGYRYVGLRLTEVTGGDAWPIIEDRALLRQTQEAMRAHEVGVLDVELARLLPDTKVDDFRPMFDTAAALDAKHVLTQAHDTETERLVANYAAFCDLAAEYGMTADVEFLTWTKMRDVAAVCELIDAVGRDNSGLMVDTLHFSRSRCRPAELDGIPKEKFHYMQICDADGVIPDTTEGLIYTAREDRLFPGDGDLDLRGIMSHLPAGIPVGVEIPNSRIAAMMSDEEFARRAFEATRALLESMYGTQEAGETDGKFAQQAEFRA